MVNAYQPCKWPPSLRMSRMWTVVVCCLQNLLEHFLRLWLSNSLPKTGWILLKDCVTLKSEVVWFSNNHNHIHVFGNLTFRLDFPCHSLWTETVLHVLMYKQSKRFWCFISWVNNFVVVLLQCVCSVFLQCRCCVFLQWWCSDCKPPAGGAVNLSPSASAN